jgi:hypothetical protein
MSSEVRCCQPTIDRASFVPTVEPIEAIDRAGQAIVQSESRPRTDQATFDAIEEVEHVSFVERAGFIRTRTQ